MSGEPAEKPKSDPAADNIRAIVDLEQRAVRANTWTDRISQGISHFVGSLTFVLVHVAWFIVWALWNSLGPPQMRFDPYPYGLLTFIVSLEGVLVGTFVLIAQNRMSRQSDQRDHLDLQVDLLSEQEMTVVLLMLRRISERLGIPAESEENERAARLTQETNVYDLMEKITRELPKKDRAS